MFTERNKKTIIIILLFIVFLGAYKIKVLNQNISDLEDQASDYESMLEEANSNIEEANSEIEEAQSVAWTTYEEMGDALDNMYTVDTVY